MYYDLEIKVNFRGVVSKDITLLGCIIELINKETSNQILTKKKDLRFMSLVNK